MIRDTTSNERSFIKDLTSQYWNSLSSLGFCNDSDKDCFGGRGSPGIPTL